MHCPIKIESQLFNFQIITFKRENTALDLALYQERNEVASILLQVNMPFNSVFVITLMVTPYPLASALCSCCEKRFGTDRKYFVLVACSGRAVRTGISRWSDGECSMNHNCGIFDSCINCLEG